MSIIWWGAIVGGVIGLINYIFCIGADIYTRFIHEGRGAWLVVPLIFAGLLRSALTASIGAPIGWAIR